MSDYVVYLVKYGGGKHPPYYIGSTSRKKISEGYKGSPTSNKWAKIVRKEMKENPQLYSLEILESCTTRQEALEAELKLQMKNDVVKSPLYYNMSLAVPRGFFGMDVAGENNPRYGLEVSEKTRSLLREKNKGKVVVSADNGATWFVVSKEDYAANKDIYTTPKGDFNPKIAQATRDRVKNGTHHFCDPKVQKMIAEKRKGMRMSDEQKRKLSESRKNLNIKPWQAAQHLGHENKWLLVYKLFNVYQDSVDLSRKNWKKLIVKEMISISTDLNEYWCGKLASRFKGGWNPQEDLEFKEWFNENCKN